MALGKLVRSSSHTDYVCQVYGPSEVEIPPAATEYAFGTFVRIGPDQVSSHLIGLVYDTVLLNPDFGSLGPRFSPAPDLAIFSPDYLAEKVTLVEWMDDVLSQCMTQFILRVVNPVDQARVAESVESVGRDLLKELPALSKGQAIVTSAAVNTPVLCRVRGRITKHGAEDMDALARWLEWFASGQAGRRDRDSALPTEPATRGRNKLFKS